MRRFLSFFYLFFVVLFFASQVNSQTLADELRAWEENSILEQGIFTGKKGLGNFQKTPFGKFRLISCSGGIPDNKMPFFMVEGLLADGWVLDKPNIPSLNRDDILAEEILYPVQALDEKYFSGYKNEVYFSLVYLLKNNVTKFEINKKFPVRACKGTDCFEEVLDLSLAIENDTTFPTDICAKMMRRYQMMIKKPKKDEVIAKLSVIDDNHVQLLVDFKKNVSYLALQAADMPDFNVVQKDFQDKRASLLIETDVNKMPSSFVATLISSLGIFEVELAAQKSMYIFVGSDFDFSSVVWAGIWLFFLSPLFYLFLSLPNEKELLLKEIKRIFKIFFVIILTLGVLFYFNPSLIDFFEIHGILILISGMTLAYLLVKPKFDLTVAAVLFFLMPKPYLLDLVQGYAQKDISILINFLISFLIAFSPFYLFRKVPRLFEEIKKLKKYPIFIRLPQCVLIVWLLTSLVGTCYNPTQTNDDINRLKQNKQTVFVSLENGLCFTCLLNKLTFSYYLNHMAGSEREHIYFKTLSLSSASGRAFVDEYKLTIKSQGVLFGPKQAYGERVYSFVPFEGWYPLFKKVMPIEKEKIPDIIHKEPY